MDRKSWLDRLILLAQIAERRNGLMEGHLERVGHYTSLIAELLGYTEEESHMFGRIAKVHDIGKIVLPARLLNYSGPLSYEDRKVVELHPVKGDELVRILAPENGITLTHICNAVRYHHEWWNGTGYPEGRSGREIPLLARIVTVCDVFDALTHPRPYKPAWSVERTLEYIVSLREKQFDPQVVDALKYLLRRE